MEICREVEKRGLLTLFQEWREERMKENDGGNE
jgi:hypothetical protein